MRAFLLPTIVVLVTAALTGADPSLAQTTNPPPPAIFCPEGTSLLNKGDAASSASDTERATDYYQRAIEVISACITDAPPGRRFSNTMWLDRAAAHMDLGFIFSAAHLRDNAKDQFMWAAGDMLLVCAGTSRPRWDRQFDEAEANLYVLQLRDLAVSFPEMAFDFSSYSACVYRSPSPAP